ncbi:3-deoxy-D-manno-octulosonic-acid transferase domain protein, partial [Bordetella pertussis H934]
LFGAAIGRGQLQQAWLPYDFPGATRRFLARHAPRCGLLMEREVWPNLLAAARAQGVPMALVSARPAERLQDEWIRLLVDAAASISEALGYEPGVNGIHAPAAA